MKTVDTTEFKDDLAAEARRFIDLRSDTVSHPTPAMREAMANARVGDDVYQEDPTINQLQALAAEMLGKEAGLFVPSGTMGNLAAILAHCGRGDEAILGDRAHTFLYEAGGASALGGVHVHTVPNQVDGTIHLDDLRGAIRPDDPHFPTSRLVVLENTHNRCGGVSISLDYTQTVGEFAREQGLVFHLDGARIFNAAVDLGVSPADLVEPVDSITFCLSKGLSAPVGSVLCGSEKFIYRAHRIRKQLGGGMRQGGILAAAGIVALETMIERLADDHARAQRLAAGLSEVPGVLLDPGTPYTNMVFIALKDEVPLNARQISDGLKARGVLAGVVGPRRFRLVTHYWIDDEAVDRAVRVFQEVLKQ
jgi:threonine aldolase